VIPYGKQDIKQEDIDCVIDVLKSDFLTQGPKVPEFENVLAQHTGARYAFAVNSATSALHIACLALGLKAEDWLWTSPITFVASANAGRYCGANVDFVDIDPDTYNICPKKLQQKLIKASSLGRLPKILIPVHLCGQPCDMREIQRLCQEYDVKIIEDASHAIGARYFDEPVGNCRFSDVTVFSFHPVKIVTTAEGGAALTNDADIAQRLELYRSHGVTRDPKLMVSDPHGPWYYEQIALGYNYRMTDIQAALGITQMRRLDEFLSKRRRIAERYDIFLRDLPVVTPHQMPETSSAFHLYPVRLALESVSVSHRSVFEGLREKGIGVNIHYIPVHTQPYYKLMGFNSGDFPEAERYYSEAISLPVYPGLTAEDQHIVVNALSNLLS